MDNRFLQFAAFALAAGALIVALKLLNWLPLALDRDVMRRYESIDEVRESVNIEKVYVPLYFPQRLTWPPSEIVAQGKPYPAIVMEFNDVERGTTTLIISQTTSPNFKADDKIPFTTIKESADYTLKEREAHLEVGTCEGGGPCSRISWKEGGYRIVIVMRSEPFELIKIAESMLRTPISPGSPGN